MDVRRVGDIYHVFAEGGQTDTGRDALEWARLGEELGAHHRARQGEPGPRRSAAPRLHRRPPKPALGGRLHLRADLVGVLLHRLRHGPVLFSRRIVGWATSSRMDTDFVLGALEQAIRRRKHREGRCLTGLVHHSDHGSQYLSIAYTGRLVDEGIEASAGAVGSSYDNAAAEALGKSYKRELVWRDGPWKDR